MNLAGGGDTVGLLVRNSPGESDRLITWLPDYLITWFLDQVF
jgi:hypothetical protein